MKTRIHWADAIDAQWEFQRQPLYEARDYFEYDGYDTVSAVIGVDDLGLPACRILRVEGIDEDQMQAWGTISTMDSNPSLWGRKWAATLSGTPDPKGYSEATLLYLDNPAA